MRRWPPRSPGWPGRSGPGVCSRATGSPTWRPNCAEMLVAHFAVPLAGGVLVTINTRLSAEEIAAIVEHSGAVFLLADAPLVEPALGNLAAVTTLREIVTLPRRPARRSKLAFTTGYDDLLAAGSDDPIAYRVADEGDAISVNYTSGTTGSPKGVVYTHRGAYLNSLGEVIHQGFVDGSSYLWTLPMFHCNGWCTTWALTAVAGTHVCLRADQGRRHLAVDRPRRGHPHGRRADGAVDDAGVPAGASAAAAADRDHRRRAAQPVDHRGLRRPERHGRARLRADRDLRPVHGVRTAGLLARTCRWPNARG